MLRLHVREGQTSSAIKHIESMRKSQSGLENEAIDLIENKLQDDGSKMGVDLTFTNIEDFEPDQIVQNVEPLRKLVEARQKLADLRSKMDGNEKLEGLLESVIADAGKQKELSDALGLEANKEE